MMENRNVTLSVAKLRWRDTKKHHSLHRHLETLARIALFGKAAIAAAEQFTREISCRKDDLQFQRGTSHFDYRISWVW